MRASAGSVTQVVNEINIHVLMTVIDSYKDPDRESSRCKNQSKSQSQNQNQSDK